MVCPYLACIHTELTTLLSSGLGALQNSLVLSSQEACGGKGHQSPHFTGQEKRLAAGPRCALVRSSGWH